MFSKALNIAQNLISSHLLSGSMSPGDEIALKIDQGLLRDALGTIVMLGLEALGLDRVVEYYSTAPASQA